MQLSRWWCFFVVVVELLMPVAGFRFNMFCSAFEARAVSLSMCVSSESGKHKSGMVLFLGTHKGSHTKRSLLALYFIIYIYILFESVHLLLLLLSLLLFRFGVSFIFIRFLLL